MPNSPLTNTRIPDTTYAPDIADIIHKAIYDIEVNGTPRFTTTTARDTAYNAYVSAGGTLANGRRCYTDDAGWWRRVGGTWVADKVTGTIAPTSGWGAGLSSYYVPSYLLSADGRVTLRGMFQRTGTTFGISYGGTLATFATLPAAIVPPSDISPIAYFGDSTTSVTARLYVAGGSTALQIEPMASGTYSIPQTTGYVNIDSVSWFI